MKGWRYLPEHLKNARRQSCLDTVRRHEAAGLTRTAAVAIAAGIFEFHSRTVREWLFQLAEVSR